MADADLGGLLDETLAAGRAVVGGGDPGAHG